MRKKDRFSLKNTSWQIIMITAIGTGIFTASCTLSNINAIHDMQNAPESALSEILGSCRFVLSTHFIDLADQYFHKGVGFAYKPAFKTFYQEIAEEISPTKHIHVHGRDVEQIIPWLWFSLKMDPHNINAYLISSFWMLNELKNSDIAFDILRTAQQNNPFNSTIKLSIGEIFIKRKEYKKAKGELDAALAFWERNAKLKGKHVEPDEKATIQLYRGVLFEKEHNYKEAIRCYKDNLAVHPQRHDIIDRIEALKEDKPSSLASSLLNDTLISNDDEKAEYFHKHRESKMHTGDEHKHH